MKRDPYTLDLFAPEVPNVNRCWGFLARPDGEFLLFAQGHQGFNAVAPASWSGGYSEVHA